MNRHYTKLKLFNQSGQPVNLFTESVWNLPPYVIAQLGGELSQVMLSAAEQYLAVRCLDKQKEIFEREAFRYPKKV